MRLLIRVAGSLAVLAAHSPVQAQAPAGANASPVFEVVSVKLNKSGTLQANMGMTPNGLNIVNLPLRPIIQLAYGINQPTKLVGVPDWAVSERFDINARAAGQITLDERRLMMQAMLADRFNLVARREKREVSVLALMLLRSDGKLGPNLVESKGCIQPAAARAAAAGGETPASQMPVCGVKGNGPGRAILTGTNLTQFASVISLMIGRTIVDKTGLTGSYDIDFRFAPEQQIPEGAGAPIPTAELSGTSVFTAVREQLGLKLESQKDLEEVLVIDHVERPSAN